MADYRGTASADSIDQAALGIPDWSALYGLVGNDTLTIGRGVGLEARATPGGEGPLFVDGDHRYEGYQYIIENPRIAATFLGQYL